MDNLDQNFDPERDPIRFVDNYTSTPLHFPPAHIPPPREGPSFVAPATYNDNNTNDVADASASYAVVDLADLMRNNNNDNNNNIAGLESMHINPLASLMAPGAGTSNVRPKANNNVTPGVGMSNARPRPITNATPGVGTSHARPRYTDVTPGAGTSNAMVEPRTSNNNNNNNNNVESASTSGRHLQWLGPVYGNPFTNVNTPGAGSSSARTWANTSVPLDASIYHRGDLQWLEPVYGNPFPNVNTPGADSSNARPRANANFTPGASTSNARPSVQLEFQELRTLEVLEDPLDRRHCLCSIVDKSSGVYEIIVQVHGGYRGLEHLLVFVLNTEPLIDSTGQYMWGDQDPQCNSIEHLFPPLENTNHMVNNAEPSATGVGNTGNNAEPSAAGVRTQPVNIHKIYYFDLFGRSVEQLNDVLNKYSIQITNNGQIVPYDTYFAIFNKILKAVDSDKANPADPNGGGGGGGGGYGDIIIIDDEEDDSSEDDETEDGESDEESDEEEVLDDEEAQPGRPSVQEQRERTANMTVDDLEPLLHLTELGAANALNICLTTLKLLKKKLYLSRWPYRKINAVNKKLDKANERLKKKHDSGITTGARVIGIEKKIESLLQERARLYKEALTPMPPPGKGPHPPPGPPPPPGAGAAAVA